MYFVYKIVIDDKTRYIGITNDIKKREWQHNYQCFKKLGQKTLYKKIRAIKQEKITIKALYQFPNKWEASICEAYLILADYFGVRELWQSPPKSIYYHR